MSDPVARARLEKLVDLLPCPFCGGLPISSYERDGRVIACQQCFARAAPAFHGRADQPSAEERACSNWNHRPLLADSLPREGERRCSTCKHFVSDVAPPLGTCCRWERGYAFDPKRLPLNEVLIEDDEGWANVVGPDFGCVLHEPADQLMERDDG